MRKFFIILLLNLIYFVNAQIPNVFWETYVYFIPNNTTTTSCYVEVAMSINPYSLHIQRNKDSSFFAAVKGIIEIFDNDKMIKKDSFVVKSPTAKKLDSLSYFGYLRRYWIDNNKSYWIQLTIQDIFDNKDSTQTNIQKPQTVSSTKFSNNNIFIQKKQIQTAFTNNSLCFSSIQFIDYIEKTQKQDMYFKHGYTIVPYNDNYFPEYMDNLKFLVEIYNADTIFGKQEPFVVYYKILDKDNNNKVLENFGGFKKMNANKTNVLIGQLSIKDLPSGNYYLSIEIKDKFNKAIKDQLIYFQRKNKTIAKQSSFVEEQFFGQQNHPDTLKMWLEALWPIANNIEKDWIINQTINKDPQMMKNFMIDFWEKRASDTASPVVLAKRYYSKLNYVMKNFKCGKIAPYYTDRGRVYLQYGDPNQRTIQLNEPGAYPYEIWQYYRIYDAATNQFFTNRRFVFVNKGIADECYTLIHSDMRGEFNNPNWQREIIKHDLYDINNPYQQQQKNYGNNFDKLYQNPQ